MGDPTKLREALIAIARRLKSGETGWMIEDELALALLVGTGKLIATARCTMSVDAAAAFTKSLVPSIEWITVESKAGLRDFSVEYGTGPLRAGVLGGTAYDYGHAPTEPSARVIAAIAAFIRELDGASDA